ncbi:MAG: GH39 family glycosyl hydrolase [Terriglobia bacterium]
MNRRRFVVSAGAAMAGALGGGGFTAAEQGLAASADYSAPVLIEANHVAAESPHYWEFAVGGGHAILTLRTDYHRDLQSIAEAAGIRSVRFHGIFDHEVGVCTKKPGGGVEYNFQYVDQIYDSLVDLGLHPFVELSFMPPVLASGDKTVFWYQGNITPPRSMSQWVSLVEIFARHLVSRYGASEVRQWKFEVWNEPNLNFWAGTQAGYFDFYHHTAIALKSADPQLQAGGPATAQTAWIPEFLSACRTRGSPVDFVSTHIYADDPQESVFGKQVHYPLDQVIPRALAKVRDQVLASASPHLPIFITEWNSTYMNESLLNDTAFNASFISNTLNQCADLVEGMSFWCSSDVFEEQGVPKELFYGGYGMIASRRIPKPSFHAFTLLHRLGAERLLAGSGPLIATRRADESVAVLLWNFTPRDEEGKPVAGATVTMKLSLKELGNRRNATIIRVDDQHGSALPSYHGMGSPRYPTLDQIDVLRRAAQLPPAMPLRIGSAEPAIVSVELPPRSIALIELKG